MSSLKSYCSFGLVVVFVNVGSAAVADGPSSFPQGPSLRETGRIGPMSPQGSGELPREGLGNALGMPSETTVQQAAFVDRKSAAGGEAGSIDPDVLEREVQARLATAQSCRIDVARRKQIAPGEVVTGSLILRWTILPSGTVGSAAVISTMADDADLTDCVKKQMFGWTFTRPRGGAMNVERTFQLNQAQQR